MSGYLVFTSSASGEHSNVFASDLEQVGNELHGQSIDNSLQAEFIEKVKALTPGQDCFVEFDGGGWMTVTQPVMNMNKVQGVIHEAVDGDKSTKVSVEINAQGIFVTAEGYDGNSGDNIPVVIEIANSELRVVAWADINKEDPTDIIALEGALEKNRELDETVSPGVSR